MLNFLEIKTMNFKVIIKYLNILAQKILYCLDFIKSNNLFLQMSIKNYLLILLISEKIFIVINNKNYFYKGSFNQMINYLTLNFKFLIDLSFSNVFNQKDCLKLYPFDFLTFFANVFTFIRSYQIIQKQINSITNRLILFIYYNLIIAWELYFFMFDKVRKVQNKLFIFFL